MEFDGMPIEFDGMPIEFEEMPMEFDGMPMGFTAVPGRFMAGGCALCVFLAGFLAGLRARSSGCAAISAAEASGGRETAPPRERALREPRLAAEGSKERSIAGSIAGSRAEGRKQHVAADWEYSQSRGSS